MVRFAREPWQRDPRAGILVVVAGACVAAFCVLVAMMLLAPGFIAIDTSISQLIRSVDYPGSHTVALVTSTIGSFWPIALLTLITAALFYAYGRRFGALMLIVAMAGGAVINVLANFIFVYVRPLVEQAFVSMPDGYGLLSGRALSSLIYFGCIALLILGGTTPFHRKMIVTVLCAAAAISIALSRIFLGVHYFGDVLASWMLGVGWLAVVSLISLRWSAGTVRETHARAATSLEEDES